jgi:hypothetical protein
MPHWPVELALPELPELLPQHMLELPLELPLDPELPTHDSEPTIRLANEVKPKPDAICGRTVTNKTKLAAAITAMRALGCQLIFMPHPALSQSGETPKRYPCWPTSARTTGGCSQGAAK